VERVFFHGFDSNSAHLISECFVCFALSRSFNRWRCTTQLLNLNCSVLHDCIAQSKIGFFELEKPLPFFYRPFFLLLEKKRRTPDRQQWLKCEPSGYLDRLHEINRRVWFYLAPVAADKRDNIEIFFEDFCLASTLHEFTKRFSWKLSCRESCVWSTIISTRRMCHVRDYRQFTRKLLPNSKLRKRLRLLGWPNWIAWNEFLLLATLHINGLVNRNGSLYSSFFFAWSVKFSIGVAVVVS